MPFVDAIWTNLRFEVRNGEVESTIGATLEVLRSLGQKLNDTDLVRFCTTVLQDCLGDLNNPNFTAQAGKLLMSVLSAKPEAFGIIVTPTLSTVQSELRRDTSPKHTRQLLSLIESIIAIRTQQRPREVVDSADIDAFEVTIPAFQSLYAPLRQIAKRSFSDATDTDALLVGTEAATALAGLATQRTGAQEGSSSMLDPESIEALVGDLLDHYMFIVTNVDRSLEPHRDHRQDVHYQLRSAVQLCAHTHPAILDFVLERIFSTARSLWTTETPGLTERIETLLRDAASIATLLELPADVHVQSYVAFVVKLLTSMEDAFKTYQPDVWRYHVFAAQEAWICMIHAWENLSGKKVSSKISIAQLNMIPSDPRFQWDQWVLRLRRRYPSLPTIQDESTVVFEENTGIAEASVDTETSIGTSSSVEENDPTHFVEQSLVDIRRLGLYVLRELYRTTTEVVPETETKAISTDTRFLAIELDDMFTEKDKDAEDKFLIASSQYAKAVVSKLGVRHQMDLFLADEVIALFHSNEIVNPDDFHLTRKTEHIIRLEGRQVRECLMSPPNTRLEQMLSGERGNVRCPPVFPISNLKRGRAMTLSYGILAALQSFPSAGTTGGLNGAFEPWVCYSCLHKPRASPNLRSRNPTLLPTDCSSPVFSDTTTLRTPSSRATSSPCLLPSATSSRLRKWVLLQT